jgi:hypothetical protein
MQAAASFTLVRTAFLLSILSITVSANPARSFCGGGNMPTPDDCVAAMGKVNPDQIYTGHNRFDAGDCTIEAGSLLSAVFGTESISGKDIIFQAQDILEDGCRGVGWCQDSGPNVSRAAINAPIDCRHTEG